MRVIEFQTEPIFEFRYLNAGRGPGQFYEDRLPVHHARVDRLPAGVSALVATADLQGRERFEDSVGGNIRLLGEALPERLAREVLPSLGRHDPQQVGVLLAGDFYTVPALDKRGGTGDVTRVWQAFGETFAWVAGVAGNHDTFGHPPQKRPRFPQHLHYLDGDAIVIGGMSLAGLGGIIGKATRPNRRSEDDYLHALSQLMQQRPEIVLLHDGPDGPDAGQRGLARVREILLAAAPTLLIRGHAHWGQPFAEYANGLQIVNVDARVVVLTT